MSVDPRTNAVLHHVGYVVPDMQRALRQFEREGAVVTISPTDDPIQKVAGLTLLPVSADGELLLAAPLIGTAAFVDLHQGVAREPRPVCHVIGGCC